MENRKIGIYSKKKNNEYLKFKIYFLIIVYFAIITQYNAEIDYSPQPWHRGRDTDSSKAVLGSIPAW